ncbi:MAG: hypothetical protein ACLUGJ_02960 [Blautia wexlerae]
MDVTVESNYPWDGRVIGVVNGKLNVYLLKSVGKQMVSPKDQLVVAAKQIGISFGID